MANPTSDPILFQSSLMLLNAALESAGPPTPGAIRTVADVCATASGELLRLADTASTGAPASSAAWGPSPDAGHLGNLASGIGPAPSEASVEQPVYVRKRRDPSAPR
ncbi:MAG: hypothetical protein JSU00_09850 [Acidobacteria bacterium]|nr:hypothetical protein [Acidobacteriota bacterium]